LKLGSLKSGGRDGTLVVVSRDLARLAPATDIAPTLQAALDDWDRCAGGLRRLAEDLEAGQAAGMMACRVEDLAAPLPRAYQFLDGSAYLAHVERVRRARGA
jgi:fumarylacetoacetate (FAA) hydrolase